MPPDSPRDLLLDQLRHLLAQLAACAGAPACVPLAGDRWEAYLVVVPRRPPEVEPPGPPLTEMEQAVLDALPAGTLLPAKQIARATGYAYGPRLRACLTGLARRGLVVRTPDGYRRA